MPVPDNPEFNLEQARFEVRKLGIKGFHGNEKEEAMTALLVKLGAKVRNLLLLRKSNKVFLPLLASFYGQLK